MCGFTAIVGKVDNLVESLHSMDYRGLPERFKTYHKGNIHVGHVRLPIVNLGPSGDQPIRIKEHVGFLVGEIFNFKQFSQAETDTEAALEVFSSLGIEGFHNFDGFWSFITIHKGKLFAATDYLSQKPIYYRTDIKAIASEPVALLAYGKSEFDPVFFSNVRKWGYDPTGRTPWENIKQLPAGSYWYDGNIYSYWDWNKIIPSTLRKDITEAVQNRLLGEQPIACLLSGGLDSSIVYLLCRKLGAHIQSFHIENNESEYAKMIDPATKCLSLYDLSYPVAIEYHQSPVDLGSVHPQAILAKAIAKKGYHVCLTGDGADELFGGYSRSDRYDSQASDVFVELPYYHLPRLDRLMMRETIELRTPFLSPKVVKTAMETPYLERKGKIQLKKAFADILPEEIINREKLALKTSMIQKGGLEQIETNIKLFKEIYQ